LKSTGLFRSVFFNKPAGWGRGTKNKINAIRHDIEVFVQDLNDRFTSPAGKSSRSEDNKEK
jgi:hypothetical protein